MRMLMARATRTMLPRRYFTRRVARPARRVTVEYNRNIVVVMFADFMLSWHTRLYVTASVREVIFIP